MNLLVNILKTALLSQFTKKACTHVKGGRCLVHGLGAKRKWRLKNPSTKGEGERKSKKYEGEREYYWECDIGKKNRLVQTTLKFRKTTSKSEDNPIGENPSQSTLSLENSDATVGQGVLPVQRAGIKLGRQQMNEEHDDRN